MRGVRWYLVGSLVLAALAGCKSISFEEREPWRRQAEETCLKAGSVKQGPAVVLIEPISGPGVCGADFPLKVGELGENGPLGYADEAVRPPGDVPQAGQAYPRSPPPSAYPSDAPAYPYPADERQPPRASPGYRPPAGYPTNTPFAVNPAYPADTRLPPRDQYRPAEPYEPAPPPEAPRAAPRYTPAPYPQAAPHPHAAPYPSADPPVSLSAPGVNPPTSEREGDYQEPLPRYGAPRTVPAREPAPLRPDPRPRQAPFSSAYPGGGQPVPMSPSRGSPLVATTASVSPPATLACPIVSALDRWLAEAVQPAAQKWFGQPVTGIKQISAYSCRGMNGNPNAHISEHAFGNALDIASFVLGDGHVITVEKGWRGTPEEQGFLRDIQGAACELFTTVLAPGSNVYHYNHIHVDLMRRASGRRICQPGAVAGDVVASRARARYAGRDGGVTGSIGARHSTRYSSYDNEDRGLPDAVPGED
jgi:hypothetical protein